MCSFNTYLNTARLSMCSRRARPSRTEGPGGIPRHSPSDPHVRLHSPWDREHETSLVIARRGVAVTAGPMVDSRTISVIANTSARSSRVTRHDGAGLHLARRLQTRCLGDVGRRSPSPSAGQRRLGRNSSDSRLSAHPGKRPLQTRAYPTPWSFLLASLPYLFGMVINSEPSHKCVSEAHGVGERMGDHAL